MIKTVCLALIALSFEGCIGIGKVYYSPRVDAIVIDMETLEPIPDVQVKNLKILNRSDIVVDTTQSITTKNGCLTVSGYYELESFLFPSVGTSLMQSSLYLSHPDYQKTPFLVTSFYDTDHQSGIFFLCKKSSTKCKNTNVKLMKCMDEDRCYMYDYESNSTQKKKLALKLKELKFKQNYIDRCIK